MPSANRLLALVGIVLGLVVVVYLGGKFAMSETSSVDEPAQPQPESATGHGPRARETAGRNRRRRPSATAASGAPRPCFSG